MGAFDEYRNKAWPYTFQVTLHLTNIAGGVPSNEKVAEGWLRTKLGDNDDLIREAVAQTMAERGMTLNEAVSEVDRMKNLNGFKRDPKTGLYIEGRQIKSAIKEATSVAVAADKLKARGWGKTNKGLLSYVAEHVMVIDERVPLTRVIDDSGPVGVEEYIGEPTGIVQRFVHTWRGTGIQYEEYVENCQVSFTVISDHPFTQEEWAMIWLTGEQQGLGASRSQGFGRYQVVEFVQLSRE